MLKNREIRSSLKTIVCVAQGLAEGFETTIRRLDISISGPAAEYEGKLYLNHIFNPISGPVVDYIIHEDGNVERALGKKAENEKEEIAPAQLDEEISAVEAMEGMKAAVDKLEIPKKPKPLTGKPAIPKSSKNRQERILKMYNQGYTKVKMAEEEGIGLSTINYHIQALREKGKI